MGIKRKVFDNSDFKFVGIEVDVGIIRKKIEIEQHREH